MFWKDIRRCDYCGTLGGMSTYSDTLVLQAPDTAPDGWVRMSVQGRGRLEFCSAKHARKYLKKNK